MGNTLLTYESCYTVLVQTEANLIFRLSYLFYNYPNLLQALTPGHFLIGECLIALSQRDITVTQSTG